MKRLAILLLLAACSSSPTGPSGTALPSGHYTITALKPWPSGVGGVPRNFALTVVSATESRVIFDWTAGDVIGTLPVRDTAEVNGDAYYVFWNGRDWPNYSLRFRVGYCAGLDVQFPGSIAWTGCTIAP